MPVRSVYFGSYRSLRASRYGGSIGGLQRPPPEESPPEAMGAVIRRLRLNRGWSQETLAFEVRAKSSVSPTAGAIGQIERGVTRPRPETIKGIARALGVDPRDLVEYRLAVVRRLFDERAVGLDQAIANLEVFEQAIDYPLGGSQGAAGSVSARRSSRKARR